MNTGTLIFLTAASSDFDSAIQSSGGHPDSVTHVGIYLGGNVVIDAHPDTGVSIRALGEFTKGAAYATTREIAAQPLVSAAVARAETFLGRPYNHTFLPDNEGMYCSQLVTESFLYADGRRYFDLYEMQFDDMAYWNRYYTERGLHVPHGIRGSHPQQILEQTGKFKKFA